MKLLIEFFTVEPKPPEVYRQSEMQDFIKRIMELTRSKAKFTVSIVGECIGDYS